MQNYIFLAAENQKNILIFMSIHVSMRSCHRYKLECFYRKEFLNLKVEAALT